MISKFEIEIDENYLYEIRKSLLLLNTSCWEFVLGKLRYYEYLDFSICLQKGHIKKLNKHLYEIRIRYKGMSVRLLGSYSNKIFKIVSVFNKKSQKAPKSEIFKALERINET